MDHDAKRDADNTVEHGDGAVKGRSHGGRFGPGNVFAAAQRGRPTGTRRLLREMMREAGDLTFIDRLCRESPLARFKILARL